ncbi:MAG: stage III sporulation protein AB [Roseburia sp.]|nr:stage III sporulation protein AB [Roseburia sp.]
MLKLAGIFIILCGTTALGMYKSCQYVTRFRNLTEIKKVFLYIQGEVRYRNTPMPETLEAAACKVKGPLGNFFRHVSGSLEKKSGLDFKEIWEQCLFQDVPGEILEREAREELAGMGSQLGCLDRQAQERAIDYFLDKWEFIIEKRQREKSNRLRLYYVCGVMGGLLVVIILV